jgi:hypothetical protein
VKLVDDDGRAVTGAEAYRGRNRVQEIQVPPGAGDRLELVIELPPPIRFSSMGSFVLIWPYRYGDKTYEGRAKFLNRPCRVGALHPRPFPGAPRQ